VACAGTPGVGGPAAVAAPPIVNLQEHEHHAHHLATADGAPVAPLTINVYVTDGGMRPDSIFVPLGHEVQLVMRNVGTSEHHFRVVGMSPRDLMRLVRDDPVAGPVAAGHAHDHGAGLAPLGVSTSIAGVRRSGAEVHAYAFAGGMDVIVFTPIQTGTFAVECPLHPGMKGELTVF
jgi:hypothetical protein